MSERHKNTNPISNESIINEITRDLPSLSVEEHPEDSIVSPGTSAGDSFPPLLEDNTVKPPEDDIPEKDYDSDHEGEKSDTDIDEETLKNNEIDLTEDQKAEQRIIAEELKKLGNDAFKLGDYDLSIEKYTDGLRTCPLSCSELRAVLYCNRSAAKMKLERYKKAIQDCTKAIEFDDKYVKAYTRRAQCYEKTEKFDESFADYKKILELDPSNKEAQGAVVRLPPLIEERNEKLKTEMMGKLKDLGNMILKPFGLSTDNFHLEQDPDSKGYKINFKQ